MEAGALAEAGGIGAIATSTIDDVALARAVKGAGFDIWLGLAGEGGADDAPRVESLRRYPRLAGIWEIVARERLYPAPLQPCPPGRHGGAGWASSTCPRPCWPALGPLPAGRRWPSPA